MATERKSPQFLGKSKTKSTKWTTAVYPQRGSLCKLRLEESEIDPGGPFRQEPL